MLGDVIEFLACPHCGRSLELRERVVACASGHSFDVARQGYVNLLPGDARAMTADNTEMVWARAALLDTGRFAPIADAVAAAARGAQASDLPGCVVDVGAGTGYYLARTLDALPGLAGLALDLSKAAARRAARAHVRIGAAVCDTWHALPVRDGSAALVLDIFAPRNAAEFHRVLTERGRLIVVTPTGAHLHELVEVLGLVTVDEDKEARLERQLSGLFELERLVPVERMMELTQEEVGLLVRMGPSAWHVDARRVTEAIREMVVPARVTLSARIATYRRVGGS
ncbi:MAG: 23S rRNA methyltransferase [Coriobacteriales bacterium]|nr:23S rRNA methyltransferase [Coriobacteriales bacterium]